MDCNNCLPLDRLVSVDITTQTVFDERQFGSMAILTDNLNGGIGGAASVVNALNREKQYTTREAAVEDWDASTEVMKAITAAFAQTPRVSEIKVIYVDSSNVNTFPNELTEVFKCLDCTGIISPDLRDRINFQIAIADFIEPLNGKHFFFADTLDPGTKDPNDAATTAGFIAAGGYSYTSAYYKADAEQFAAAAMSFALGQDVDSVGAAFTMAFNKLNGLTPDLMSDAEATAITGVLPSVGQSESYGHFANTYTCVGGEEMMLYGSMGDGTYFDTALVAQYMKSTIQNNVAQLMASGVVGNDNSGLKLIGQVIEFSLGQYQGAGWIVGDNREGGQQGYTVYIPGEATLAKRKDRITDAFRFEARLTGRVHATSVVGELQY